MYINASFLLYFIHASAVQQRLKTFISFILISFEISMQSGASNREIEMDVLDQRRKKTGNECSCMAVQLVIHLRIISKKLFKSMTGNETK